MRYLVTAIDSKQNYFYFEVVADNATEAVSRAQIMHGKDNDKGLTWKLRECFAIELRNTDSGTTHARMLFSGALERAHDKVHSLNMSLPDWSVDKPPSWEWVVDI